MRAKMSAPINLHKGEKGMTVMTPRTTPFTTEV